MSFCQKFLSSEEIFISNTDLNLLWNILKKNDLLDLRWRSFHNFFVFIFTYWWKDYFNKVLLQQVLFSNFFAVSFSLVFVILERLWPNNKDGTGRYLNNFSRTLILIGLFGGAILIPSIWAELQKFGASNSVWLIPMAILVIAFPIIFGLLNFTSIQINIRLRELVERFRDLRRLRVFILGANILLLDFVLGFQISLSHFSSNLPAGENRIWINIGAILIGILSLTSLAIMDMKELFQWPLQLYFKRIKAFLMDYPAFIFILTYSAIIILAQLYDWDILSAEGQRYIREEVIELAGAFQLVLAALMVPTSNNLRKTS